MSAIKDKYPSIEVKWADHWVEYGDQELSWIKEKADAIYGEYVGRKVYENKQILVICSNVWEGVDGEANFSDPMFIMKRCIVERSDK